MLVLGETGASNNVLLYCSLIVIRQVTTMTLLSSSTIPPTPSTPPPIPSLPTCQDLEQGPLEYIIRLMVEHNDYLFTRLVASSIRSLSLVSRTIFKLMSPRISSLLKIYFHNISKYAIFSTTQQPAILRLACISFNAHSTRSSIYSLVMYYTYTRTHFRSPVVSFSHCHP